jgi:hypothetical protein
MTYDPLRALAYHTKMKCIVCLDCRMAIPSKQIKGHIKNADHRPKVGEGKLIVPHLKSDLDVYLSDLVLDDDQVQRPAPGSVIPPYSWLEKPQKGWVCKICNDYAGQTQETMRKHLKMRGTCRSSHDQSFDEISNSELMDPCSVQRFGPSHPFKSYFRVYPNVSVETGTQFTDFLSNLPDSLKEGAPLYSSDAKSIQTKEFDLPPFLAKTKWTEAVHGYSRRKMIISVALPSKDDQLSRLRPLGKKLFTSIRSTTHLPHQILNGLTAYKTKK